MKSFARQAKKLQSAINQRTGAKLLINTQQWYSNDRQRVVTCYVIRQSVCNDNDKYTTIELFKTYSHIQMLLWLRDYWYTLNNWEVPTDNKKWEEMKQQWDDASKPKD